jgi:hypothetical protein
MAYFSLAILALWRISPGKPVCSKKSLISLVRGLALARAASSFVKAFQRGRVQLFFGFYDNN